MPYNFKLSTVIPAKPKAVYDAWLDSRVHSAMTGGKATQSGKVGAKVTAWDGYITGRNLDLATGKRIVQTWRTTQFTDRHGDSVITVTLAAVPGGTRLMLEHANVPDDQTSYEERGWQEHYFEPMQRHFRQAAKVAAASATARKAKKVKAKARKKSATPKKAAKRKAAAKKRGKKSHTRR
jgi:uncharacterized protein YndB with AHSA1/START domain